MNKNKVYELDVEEILPNRFQPRINFGETQINELAESIREHGVINPIVVRKISDKFEIISGERRYKACIIANKSTIPAIIVDLNDREAAEVAIIENVQRQDLTPIEEAVSYKKILDMGMTQEALARKLGKNQSTVANKLRLLNLNEEVQEALLYQKISERHARSLLRINHEGQKIILQRILNERLTVRKTDQAINDYILQEKDSNKENKTLEENKQRKIIEESIIKTDDQNIKEQKIEILDFDIENKGENKKMNDNIIPNTNIINDTTTEQQPITNDFNNNIYKSSNEINPGFMDVDKIENQAQDIYVDNKPIVDIESLLHPDENAPQPVNTDKEEPEELPTGKFFNIMPEEETQNNEYVSDLEDVKANVDFIPKAEEKSVPSSFDFDSFFDSSFQPFKVEDITTEKAKEENNLEHHHQIVSDVLNQNSSEEKINSEPLIFENTDLNKDNVYQTQNINSTLETISDYSTFDQNNDISDTKVPEANFQTNNLNFSTNLESTYQENEQLESPSNFDKENNNVNQLHGIEIPNTQIKDEINNFDQPIVTPQVEDINPQLQQLNSLGIGSDFINIESKQEEKLEEKSIPSEKLNIKQAIEMIRACSDAISALGFRLDVEEYDLENIYEFMIKIQK